MGAYTFNKKLINHDGLKFIKLLGTGSKDGFSIIPDFASYVMISAWENDILRKKFTDENKLFKEIIKKTGQVCIQIRDVQGVDDNPFDFETVKKNIEDKLNPEFEGRFKIMLVPNITNICYGRGVGYKIEEIVLPEEIQKISATKIRAKMREEGKLK